MIADTCKALRKFTSLPTIFNLTIFLAELVTLEQKFSALANTESSIKKLGNKFIMPFNLKAESFLFPCLCVYSSNDPVVSI